jgi:hypothetical protein
MRPVTACLQCRVGKRKCDRKDSGHCVQCLQRKLTCSAASEARADVQAARLPWPLGSSQTPFERESVHLVDLYFRYMHDKPHTLFHEPSTKASVASKTIPRTVLMSMMGLSARYDQHHYNTFLVSHLTRCSVQLLRACRRACAWAVVCD